MNVKRKGSAGEREFATILTERGFPAHRNEQRLLGGYGNPDVSADGLGRFHFEVKRAERLSLPEAMRQARQDCADRIPVVVHRRNREEWLLTIPLTCWLDEVRRDGEVGRND